MFQQYNPLCSCIFFPISLEIYTANNQLRLSLKLNVEMRLQVNIFHTSLAQGMLIFGAH